MDWNFDMDAAPRDGTTILGWEPAMAEPAPFRWERGQRGGRETWMPVWNEQWLVESQTDLSGTTYSEGDYRPTAWTPLPKAPEGGKEEG